MLAPMPPNTPGVPAKKPPSVLWKPLKVDGWGLFKAAAKFAKASWSGDAAAAAKEAFEALDYVQFQENDGHLAWALVQTSMAKAVATLLRGVKERLKPEAFAKFEEHVARLDQELDAHTVAIDQEFFDHPGWSPYAREVTRLFRAGLVAFEMGDTLADWYARQLSQLFSQRLDKEWLDNKEKFAKLLPENRRTPFTAATGSELEWAKYAAWLDEEANRRVFDEDFGLTSVYVPLRAYGEMGERNWIAKRIVGHAEDMLDAWLEESRTNDAVRVVEGDPGAGKSSLARRYAATRFGRNFAGRWWRVILVPLHDEAFVAGKSIEDAAAEFTRRVSATELVPLDRTAPGNTLLILDGLDELSRGGQFGRDVIRAFMSQVTALLKAWNDRESARLLVLICGRPVAVGEIKAEVRADGAVLNLLPFLVNEQTTPEWFRGVTPGVDPRGLLECDQRAEWYQKYSAVRGLTDGDGLHAKIKIRADLDAVTAQPLLNYLIAFLTRETEAGELPANLCGVYEALLYKIWQRGWDRGQVPAIEKLNFEPFCQLLETIALTAWHSGNPRSVRICEVEDRLTGEQKAQLETFEKEAKTGVLRLLFAFFVRPGAVNRGDQTYEFTHKTFAEYLVSRRLVREIDILADDWKKSAGGRAWKDDMRLQEWAELFGPTALDDDMREFLVNALEAGTDHRNRQRPGSGLEAAANWQTVLTQLLNVAVRDGMPMHMMTMKLRPRPTYQEMDRQAQNSELALLHTLSACFGITKIRSRITALEVAPQDWMGRRWCRPMFNFCYSFLRFEKVGWSRRWLTNCNLSGADLSGADLRGADLSRADLSRANLSGADLSGANLSGADLGRADLIRVFLNGADLSVANLREANLSGAFLNWADLGRADLNGAFLSEAELRGASLIGADLSKADLNRANLSGGNLSEAHLRGANLIRASLIGSNLSRSDLRWADMNGTGLSGAELSGADLSGTNLSVANLRWAHLNGAELRGASGLTTDQLLLSNGDPITMPDGNPPKVNWRSAKSRTRKKPAARDAEPSPPSDPGSPL